MRKEEYIKEAFWQGWKACAKFLQGIQNPGDFIPGEAEEFVAQQLLKTISVLVRKEENAEAGDQ